MFSDQLVLIKGGGDLATGIGWRLYRCGFPVVIGEIEQPLAVRRKVSFAQAVFDGEVTVEGVTARRCYAADVADVLAAHEIPVVVDPTASLAAELMPSVLVDAVMAKHNTGTHIDDAPLVIALGPGFSAGVDCDLVIETHRGHTLGRVIEHGSALADTGVPGALSGVAGAVVSTTRVLRAPATGDLLPHVQIGEAVEEGDLLATVTTADGATVRLTAPFGGVLRGLIHQSVPVRIGMKIGDLDPRADPDHAVTISEKSLAIGGGVLEAILHHLSLNSSTDRDEALL